MKLAVKPVHKDTHWDPFTLTLFGVLSILALATLLIGIVMR